LSFVLQGVVPGDVTPFVDPARLRALRSDHLDVVHEEPARVVEFWREPESEIPQVGHPGIPRRTVKADLPGRVDAARVLDEPEIPVFLGEKVADEVGRSRTAGIIG
jgi:hypothetical protein